MKILLACLTILAPQMAFACGGLFCNAQTPVNQAAERILFAKTESGLDMHVQITYQGPPTEFGWLLPVPQDVEYGLSSEQVFAQIDQLFAPRFILRTEIDPNCRPDFDERGSVQASAGGDADAGAAPPSEPNVAVLSREAVGAFDLAVLLPETVEDLRRWLDDNGYQIPEAADATLHPYVEMGSAFIALKLLPTAGSGDVSPIRLSFNGDIPAIPIVPTSVAADPDMGIIVNLLGDARAVSVNYRHVEINEATIDWNSGGSNYADVVSQAVDEAGGRAFVTDFAGVHEGRIRLRAIPEEAFTDLTRVGAADAAGVQLWLNIERALMRHANRNDTDIARIARSVITVPDDIDMDDFLRRPRSFLDHADANEVTVDVDALIEKLRREVNEPREAINTAFETNPYLTRLYSTMSADEMTVDPMFGWNRDLPQKTNLRRATRRIRCFMGTPDFENAVIETESGVTFRERDGSNPNEVRRQDGETVRGLDLPSALIIEEQMPAGQPRLVTDNTETIKARIGLDDHSGCACDASSGANGSFFWLALLAFPFIRRRIRT